MKTPSEVMHAARVVCIDWDEIAAIQKDAWKQGMTDAAAVLMGGSFVHDEAPDWKIAQAGAKAIERKRDAK